MPDLRSIDVNQHSANAQQLLSSAFLEMSAANNDNQRQAINKRVYRLVSKMYNSFDGKEAAANGEQDKTGFNICVDKSKGRLDEPNHDGNKFKNLLSVNDVAAAVITNTIDQVGSRSVSPQSTSSSSSYSSGDSNKISLYQIRLNSRININNAWKYENPKKSKCYAQRQRSPMSLSLDSKISNNSTMATAIRDRAQTYDKWYKQGLVHPVVLNSSLNMAGGRKRICDLRHSPKPRASTSTKS